MIYIVSTFMTLPVALCHLYAQEQLGRGKGCPQCPIDETTLCGVRDPIMPMSVCLYLRLTYPAGQSLGQRLGALQPPASAQDNSTHHVSVLLYSTMSRGTIKNIFY